MELQNKKSFSRELIEFLKEYSIIGLAIGVITAQISKDLVDSLVRGLFVPLVALIVPTGKFSDLIFYVRNVKFDLGGILNAFLTFLIVMIFLYLIVKKILKKDELLKKK